MTAWVWIVGPTLVLAASIWHSAQEPFGPFNWYPQYFVLWALLLVFVFAGLWGVIDGPGNKWLLRLSAVLMALYAVLMLLITSGHGGDHDYIEYGMWGVIFLFCVFTFIVAGMQPNSTIERDGPHAARPSL